METQRFAVKFARFILISGVICSGVIMVYGLIRYQRVLFWDFGWNLTPYDGAIVFYLLPLFIAFSLLIALKRSDAFQINAALVLVSSIVTLYVGEGLLAIVRPLAPSSSERQHRMQKAFSKQGKTVDTRTALEVLHDLRQQGLQAFFSINPYHFRAKHNPLLSGYRQIPPLGNEVVYPISGISNVTTVLCNENGEWIIAESDEYGFHNPVGLHRRGHVTIAALGDSLTHGFCVPSEENAIAVLRKRYSRTLNLGLSGNGPLVELAIFREYVEPLQPEVVLWFFYPNDLEDLEIEKKNPFWMQYLEPEYRWGFRSRQAEIDQYLIEFHHRQESRQAPKQPPLPEPTLWQTLYKQGKKSLKLLWNMLLLRHLRYSVNFRFIPTNTTPAPHIPENQYFYYCGNRCTFDFELFRQILTLVRNTVHAWNGKLYFVDLPGYGKNPTYAEQEQVLSILEDLAIPRIDIYEAFESQADPLEMFPYRLPGHYSSKGYRVVAETILRRLREDRVLEN